MAFRTYFGRGMSSIPTLVSAIDMSRGGVDIATRDVYSHPVRIYESIGQRVRTRREECDLTQAALAAAAGLARSSISNLEIGAQRVPLEQLVRIAHALGCDYRELLPPPSELVETQAGPLTVETLQTRAPATAQFLETLDAPRSRAPSRPVPKSPDALPRERIPSRNVEQHAERRSPRRSGSRGKAPPVRRVEGDADA